MRFQTKAIHTGVNKDAAYNSVMTPIYQTSTFRFEDIGTTKGYDYTRTSNPTRKALEENIRAFADAVTKAKPTGAKGNFVKKVSLTSTMGPGLRIDVSSLNAQS